jgi:SAM-dependent methyltransferase
MKRQYKAALFFMSLFTLGFEILHIRIFGYAVMPVLSYCAISLAMLGFAVGSAVLTLWPGILKLDTARTLSILLVLFGASIFVSGALLTLFPFFNGPSKGLEINLGIILTLLPSVLPYVFAGLFMAVIFSSFASMSGELYFFNLLGSSLGCLVPLFCLRAAGVEFLLGGMGAGAIVLSLSMPGRPWRRGRIAWSVAAAASASALFLFSGSIFDFKPDPKDQVSLITLSAKARGLPPPRRLMSRWDPVAKVEVYEIPGTAIHVPEKTDYRIIMVDSGANTLMMKPQPREGWGRELFEDSLYGAGYRLVRPRPDVLVIGVGGGTDIHAALHWGARSVTGAEINRTIIETVTKTFGKFSRLSGDDPRIEIVHADGRNYVKNTSKRFDMIQLSGVDTYTLNSPGAMVVVENYLYTVEAFRDFLEVLRPGGALVVVRFAGEGTRLGVIAYHALQKLGVASPLEHIALLNQKRLEGVVVKKEPFSTRDVLQILDLAARRTDNNVSIPTYDHYGVKLGAPVDLVYLPVDRDFQDVRRKLQAGTAPTDDKPYYMVLEWWSRTGKLSPSAHLVRNTWLTVLVLALIFLFLPPIYRSRTYPAGASPLLLLLFFFSIAVGYMFIEIGLIQKTIIFIGYPGGSASLVIASLLLGSGLGSYISGKLRASPLKLAAVAAPAAFLAGSAFALLGGSIFESVTALGSTERWLVSCTIIFVTGLPMGLLYPSGLRVIDEKYRPLLPWAISVNGFISAAASVVALPIGLWKGHKLLILAGATSYLLAMAAILLYGFRERIRRPVS